MNIKSNNQHDYYGFQASVVLSVNQFANAFINLNKALCDSMDAIKKAMQDELEKELPRPQKHTSDKSSEK
jgi:hypothetical protein